MHENICFADATELAQWIRTKVLSPVEVVKAHLERITDINPKINAIVTIADDVLEKAQAAEAAVMKGEPLGLLHGVPFTCKDMFDVAGVRTTRGSKLFENRTAAADATVVTRLKQAGGIFLAKTNVPEFALWWETNNLVFGRTNNPWNLERIVGGSSGGEAAAIAAGLSPLGIGSDVGGSIRLPAHYCGIVGFKPTHGRVPLTGHWPEVLLRAMHVGPMARTVRDAALAFQLMAGPDGVDPYAMPAPLPEVVEPESPLPKLRIGWSAEQGFAPVDPEVQKVVEEAAASMVSLGCEVEAVPLDGLIKNDAQAISGPIWAMEGGFYFEPFIVGREAELYPFMQKRLATPWPELRDYLKAMAGWETLKHEMAAYFRNYDLLLCPTVPLAAYPHALSELTIAGKTIAPRRKLITLVPWNLTGSPSISVPFGQSAEGLPIGVQIVGRHLEEGTVLKMAMALENIAGIHHRHPAL